MDPKNILLAHPQLLQKKLAAFDHNNFHVVSDFDRTLTTAFTNGKRFLSSYALIREGKYLIPDYPARAHALFDHYHPYEIAETISSQERNRKMQEWWQAHFELLKECGMNRGVLQDIVQSHQMQFRMGALSFLDTLAQHQVPVLIFSAGIGDLITELLRVERKLTPNLHIISNFYTFDQQGMITGEQLPFIHPFNKKEVEVKNASYYAEVSSRRNVILLGDSLGDVDMLEGWEHDTIIKIGFLNENKEQFRQKYQEEFDVVITDDGGMDWANEMLKQILK